MELLDKPIIAIVGTRRASSYTKSITKEIARAIVKAGGVVVSGGAMGVDIVAHEAAFPSTIAILAGSIDVGFVATNKNIIEKMQKEALVLSEYESRTHPRAWNFVHRNRLVVALASAVIVAEADSKSGSMTSAQLALDQQKPLFVLPHRLHESDGTQKLLMEGKAKPIYRIESLLKELGLEPYEATQDDFLEYVRTCPSYEEATIKFGSLVYEYELMGKIAVSEGRVFATGD